MIEFSSGQQHLLKSCGSLDARRGKSHHQPKLAQEFRVLERDGQGSIHPVTACSAFNDFKQLRLHFNRTRRRLIVS